MATALVLASLLLLLINGANGIRFVIDRKDCFSYNVPYAGDSIHGSFVLVQTENSWAFERAGVDLVVYGPSGYQVHDVRQRADDKFEIVAPEAGLYKFCFTNLSPVHETIAFDVHVGHILGNDEHAKDDHINPVLGQISKLEEALYTVSFEQHWLLSQHERQHTINQIMSKRLIYKAVLTNAFLVAMSFAQVYFVRRLFERKSTRV